MQGPQVIGFFSLHVSIMLSTGFGVLLTMRYHHSCLRVRAAFGFSVLLGLLGLSINYTSVVHTGRLAVKFACCALCLLN